MQKYVFYAPLNALRLNGGGGDAGVVVVGADCGW